MAGMKSAGENHPWKRFFAGRDEIRGEESSLEEIFCWRRCPVRADHGTDRKPSSACSAEKHTRSMNQNPSCRLLYTDASNTGEFLQSEIPGVLLARQHGKENHWEDVTS